MKDIKIERKGQVLHSGFWAKYGMEQNQEFWGFRKAYQCNSRGFSRVHGQ